MTKIVEFELGEPGPQNDYRKQWLRLSPSLIEALGTLAAQEQITLERLIVNLINEGLAHRLRNR